MHSIKFKRIAVKIGSNVLAGENGKLDLGCISHLVDQISELKREGKEIILISSSVMVGYRPGKTDEHLFRPF